MKAKPSRIRPYLVGFLFAVASTGCGGFATSSPDGNTAGFWVGGELAFAGPGGVQLEADAEQSFRDAATAAVYGYSANRIASVYNNLIDSARAVDLADRAALIESQRIGAGTDRLAIRADVAKFRILNTPGP